MIIFGLQNVVKFTNPISKEKANNKCHAKHEF